MHISVSGKQLDVGESLRQYVEDRIAGEVQKYFENAIDADIVFYKEAHLFCADIVVNEGTGSSLVIRGQAKEDDIYVAFDRATDRIAKQLRRYKRRLKNHNHQKFNAVAEKSAVRTGRKSVLADDGQESEDQALIIAEKNTGIDHFSVSDAVMHMNLANLPALLFVNSKTDEVNVVYRRVDGNISWVESGVVAAEVAANKHAA